MKRFLNTIFFIANSFFTGWFFNQGDPVWSLFAGVSLVLFVDLVWNNK